MPMLQNKQRCEPGCLRRTCTWHKVASANDTPAVHCSAVCSGFIPGNCAKPGEPGIIGLDEDRRNETFTYLLRDSNAKCDRVIRTLFNGSTFELDDCEALCRDRNSHSLTITPEQIAGIELVSCRELLATSKMLLEGAGSKSKATGCRIKRAER